MCDLQSALEYETNCLKSKKGLLQPLGWCLKIKNEPDTKLKNDEIDYKLTFDLFSATK